ncbi:UNVERIFIED_CONTAM: hypothetical protein Sradi_6875100 [Sesamum radiatum]|uniref:GAG-pre-integrase domain-containing protein n=1 Tax=Sesamum radiatum TaxID=300843 RepID=A0AAW2JIY3_SESRA
MDNQENAQIWHARLGHISQNRIKRLVDSKSLEIDDLDHLPACESCLRGKMTLKPFVGQSTLVSGLLDLIHSDVCGPLNTKARGLKSSDLKLKTKLVAKLKPFGRSEVGYDLDTAAKLLNMALSKTVAQTPHQIWHVKPASYKYLRLWGNTAYIKRLVGDKLDSRSSLCRFVGYPKKTVGIVSMIHMSKRCLYRETQCSWKKVFQRIPDVRNCSLWNQVRQHLKQIQ